MPGSAGCGGIMKSITFSLLILLIAPVSFFAQPPDFGRDILPILSDKCFHCHGPDAQTRKGKLRLDTKEGAFRLKQGKAVIIPGKSEESELFQRITSQDETELMPPRESNRSLTEKQKQLLKQWIDSGARWEQHWAFVAPQKPALPAVKQASWVKQPIDRFILAKLESVGLKPQADASKEAWLKRVSFDLTGLPPTLAELDVFLADTSEKTFEKQVDRLLASPRYGERMATDWLDLARYADTHGYQMDRYRSMWPWRDWVVKAFNQNLPYDQFITWQLAGDLLPNATKDQRLATAFNRLHMQNEEGGVIEEEYRVSYVVDRVNTFGTAFLGMTFDCTRCHDHKYDPFTIKDYYSLFSLFQNIDESGQTSYFTSSMPVPTLLLSDENTDRKLAEVRTRQAKAEKNLQETLTQPYIQSKFTNWLKNDRVNTFRTRPYAHFTFNELKENKTFNRLTKQNPAQAHENPQLVAGHEGQAVLLDGENGFTFPKLGHFSRTTPFSFSLWIKPPAPTPRSVVLHHSRAPIDAGSRGYELLLEQNHVAFGMHHMWPGNSLKIKTIKPLPADQWTQIAVTYDGSSQSAGIRIYRNGQSVEVEVVRDHLYKDITYEGGEPDLTLGYRFRDNGFKGGMVDDLCFYTGCLTPWEVLATFDPAQAEQLKLKPMEQLTEAEKQMFRVHFLKYHCFIIQVLNGVISSCRDEINKITNPIPEAMVMLELPQPKPAFILKRGAYDAPGDKVTGDVPAVFPSMKPDMPRNRLGLARWLLEPDHPLTARVVVNRLWQQMFGNGLVETSDNFGTQGSRPTHSELLDWLAREFAQPSDPEAKPWDMKRLLKMMALSAAYRQSSQASAEHRSKDGDNKLLGHYPVRRLSAEMLRDQALFASGLLVEKQGGPAVKPYQPDGLWEVAMGNPKYDRSKGPDLYRRSLYTFWKRTVPHPAMITFDAAERNVCIVRRQSTSTPLQALALLNDVQMVEAAKIMGQRMHQSGGSREEQLAWAFRNVTGRASTPRELDILGKLWKEQFSLYEKDQAAVQKLLAVGETNVNDRYPAAELAANTVVALALFNHDEAVHRR
ncbi:MAG: DUF1553 domain-containing protein [Planctomycetia bacterium]|nr:DUF1553 domain-containing protein [Planctomycetia bacterium]